jgi:hypothetical protein
MMKFHPYNICVVLKLSVYQDPQAIPVMAPSNLRHFHETRH